MQRFFIIFPHEMATQLWYLGSILEEFLHQMDLDLGEVGIATCHLRGTGEVPTGQQSDEACCYLHIYHHLPHLNCIIVGPYHIFG